MSLLSQKDREIAISALENYVATLRANRATDQTIYEVNTLLNWIKIDYQKNK